MVVPEPTQERSNHIREAVRPAIEIPPLCPRCAAVCCTTKAITWSMTVNQNRPCWCIEYSPCSLRYEWSCANRWASWPVASSPSSRCMNLYSEIMYGRSISSSGSYTMPYLSTFGAIPGAARCICSMDVASLHVRVSFHAALGTFD